MGALDNFMKGSGGKAFPFTSIGDWVMGEIISVDERQSTDIKTKEPAVWKDGSPKMMYVVNLQTDLQEAGDDDGQRAVFLRWMSLRAVQDAVRAAGAQNIQLGGKLKLQYVGDAPAERGAVPAKQWKAWYKKPDPASSFMGQQAVEEPADPWAAAPAQPVQARAAVNHHGQPQSEAPPAWAQPAQPIMAESDIPF